MELEYFWQVLLNILLHCRNSLILISFGNFFPEPSILIHTPNFQLDQMIAKAKAKYWFLSPFPSSHLWLLFGIIVLLQDPLSTHVEILNQTFTLKNSQMVLSPIEVDQHNPIGPTSLLYCQDGFHQQVNVLLTFKYYLPEKFQLYLIRLQGFITNYFSLDALWQNLI